MERFLGWENVVHTEVERGFDRGVGAIGELISPLCCTVAHGVGYVGVCVCGIGVVDVSELGIQNAIDVLFVLTVLFLLTDFPGMSEALGISNRARCLSFKEATKFGGSSGEPGVRVVGGFILNRHREKGGCSSSRRW